MSTQIYLFIFLVIITSFSIFLSFQFTIGATQANRAILPSIITNISGTYANPNLGFEITLPKGWQGIEVVNIGMVSPSGINPATGGLRPSGELKKVLLVLGSIKASDFLANKYEHNASTYQEFVKMTSKSIGCTVLSDSFVKINGMNSEDVIQQCGRLGEEKSLSYIFASGKNIIFIGLKGIRSAFEHNFEKFRQSMQTLKIDKPVDIESVISDLYIPNQ